MRCKNIVLSGLFVFALVVAWEPFDHFYNAYPLTIVHVHAHSQTILDVEFPLRYKT